MNTQGNPYRPDADQELTTPGVPFHRLLVGFIAQGLSLVFFVNMFVMLGMAFAAQRRNPGLSAVAIFSFGMSFLLWRIGKSYREGRFGVGSSWRSGGL